MMMIMMVVAADSGFSYHAIICLNMHNRACIHANVRLICAVHLQTTRCFNVNEIARQQFNMTKTRNRTYANSSTHTYSVVRDV